jgi:hypothetical protein
MKKRPPPGAMLVARLKERRLAREQAEKDNVENQQILSITTFEENGNIETATHPITIESKSASTEVIEPVKKLPSKSSRSSSKANFVRQQINIEDLRPSTDDYKQLTDEIRMAGRFAAVGLIAQGLRLAHLKDDQLYKDHYQTFEEYSRKEHHMSATYAYRLIRIAEMAEQLAEQDKDFTDKSQFDPFEVMLGLGHRHLMAILPLEIEVVRDVLAKGIPIAGKEGNTNKRISLDRATEKQIRAALKHVYPEMVESTTEKKLALPSDKQLVPALGQMVQMLEDWATFLNANGTPAELRAAKMVRRQLLERLANRLRRAAEIVAIALEKPDD